MTTTKNVFLVTCIGFMTAQASLADTNNDVMAVIQLKPASPPELDRYLGWHCSALLRDDYSRFRRPDCGAVAEADEYVRELKVSEQKAAH